MRTEIQNIHFQTDQNGWANQTHCKQLIQRLPQTSTVHVHWACIAHAFDAKDDSGIFGQMSTQFMALSLAGIIDAPKTK